MGSTFGRLGYRDIGPYRETRASEMPFDQIEHNISTHYNEQLKVDLRAAVTGRSSEKPNGGLCNDVNQGG